MTSEFETKDSNRDQETFGNPYDVTQDVTVVDDEGERIAAMREYVFLNLASSPVIKQDKFNVYRQSGAGIPGYGFAD